MLPRGDHDILPRKQKDIVPDAPVNLTSIALAVAWFPAAVAVTQAVYETLNFTYLGLAPGGGDTWVSPPGSNTTVFQCITTSGNPTARLAWAWGVFLIFVAVGLFVSFFVLYLHSSYHGWELIRRNPDEPRTRIERVHRLTTQVKQKKRTPPLDSSETASVIDQT